MRIACLDIGAIEQGEAAPRETIFAGPGFGQPGGGAFGQRAQKDEAMRLGAVEGEDQQHAVVEAFGRLVEQEGGIARHAVRDAVLGELEGMGGEREPVIEMPPRFLADRVGRERARGGEVIARRFVERDPLAGDIGEEGAAVDELAVEIVERVDDEN